MTYDIDFAKVVPVGKMKGDDEEDSRLLHEMFTQARNYVSSFTWCARIIEAYYGIGIGDIVAVFLFRIEPACPDIDEWLWVVTGDLPPAYLVTDQAPNAACALAGYIHEMSKWVSAANRGESVDCLIPVNVSANPQWADLLRRRLKYLQEELLPDFAEDLPKGYQFKFEVE